MREWKHEEARGEINGPEETEEGRKEAGGNSNRPADTGRGRGRQW